MIQMNFFYKPKAYFVYYFILLLAMHVDAQEQAPFTSKQQSILQNIISYALNEDETMAVFEIAFESRSLLYSCLKLAGSWGELLPVKEINDFQGGTANIGGPFFGYRDAVLYFHANFPGSEGGMDIYYSLWNGKSWSEPVNLGLPVNTAENEESPSLSAASDKIFFTRSNFASQVKRDPKAIQCKIIYFATKQDGTWNTPQAMSDPVNLGCEATPFIAPDGKTLYFSSIRGETDHFDLYYTREAIKNSWLIPVPVPGTISENDECEPEYHNGALYHTSSFVKRKVFNGLLYKNDLPDEMKPFELVNIEGTIKDVAGKPVKAEIDVLDPVTSNKLGIFFPDERTGEFSVPLLTRYAYLFHIRKHGYSFASFDRNLTQGIPKDNLPVQINLFSTIKLTLVAYDSENFKPIPSKVKVTNLANGQEIQVSSFSPEPGRNEIELPIGNEYKITAFSDGFEDGEFEFALTDDIIFSQFERNMPLNPKKKEFVINVSDFETQEEVAAEIIIYNLDRDETIVVSAEDIKSGKTSIMLRENDRYEFNIKGPKGYAFYNSTIDLKSESEKKTLDVELKPLKAKTSITLNNITFGQNSADLDELSFAELNRVVSLIQDNPSIIVEISAHTDDKGTDNYNLKLSERRAESVVKYLFEKGVPVERLVSKGYGESMPLVPNINDENRTINRRVEFKIIGFTDDTNQQ